MLKTAKAIIFDLDGTILDSINYRIKSWEKAFKDFGIDSDPEVIRLMIGYPGSMLIKKMNARNPEIEVHEEKYFAAYKDKVKLFNDVEETFEQIRNAGIKIAIVTSSRRKMMDTLKINVDALVTMDDVKNGKPDTEPYLKAMHELGVLPENTIVVGDIDNDLIPAKKLGSIAILVTHGIEKESKNKDYEIENIGGLIDILRKISWL
ncbi:MAG: HAD family phosphatase [Ferroplasma sp.]